MFDYNTDSKINKEKRKSQADRHFMDKLVRVLFISGVFIIVITIVIKWLGYLD